ncbi:serum paraoxonase/arylesterase family protein [Aspergillus karnatakaensis]|uniref:serum paraoxonase/arylesterase family protein n=1 Tax=Aspergillus karnatakaensis TaxID=1810916 RepID=UPI003CCDDE06
MALLRFSLFLVLAATLGPFLYNAVRRELTVLGVYRSPTLTPSGQEVHKIADTLQCEDLHYYAPGNLIFTACEDSISPRFGWFPGVGHLHGKPDNTGSIHVIDPKTLQSSRLTFENFPGPFITHGIDVIQDPERADAVYIFAVNHLGNPEYNAATSPDSPKARSQTEPFHHILGKKTVRHVRSVRHPLVRTSNDLYAYSPFEFYVTNDHYYPEGVMRTVEDLYALNKWSNVVRVQFDHHATQADETTGVNATIALSSLRNANGLGHGPNGEVTVTSAVGGKVWRAKIDNADTGALSIQEEIRLDSAIDNPSYYEDEYRSAGDDASGYVLGGLRRAIDLPKTVSDPQATEGVIVWHVRNGTDGEWEKRVIFEDDGSNIRSASAAALVPVATQKDGKKEAWLFVTGFLSNNAVAVKVPL